MSPNLNILRCGCLATAIGCAHGAGAQTHAADFDATAILAPVVVTAVAPSSPLTYTTDPKRPRQPLPASDGTDYLKTIPGFSAIRSGGSNGDPVLRGMFGSRLNILVDGGAIPGACPARMDAPSSYISPGNFDELVVVKGPQTVQWGPGASAGTIRFERDTARFTDPGVRFDGSQTTGSFGRSDQAADLAAGDERGYARITANRSRSRDYEDGDGRRVPSRWDKWNADLTLGLTPDAHTRYELTAGAGDGEARYAGRGMDGTQFRRDSFGLRFEKRKLGPLLDKLEARLYYNDADHVMDNFGLRTPDPGGPMPMPMASNVNRSTWGGRIAGTWKLSEHLLVVGGLDFQRSDHRERSGSAMVSHRSRPWRSDAEFSNLGVFAEADWHLADDRRWIGGLRLDRSEVTDLRPDDGAMMMPRPNPTAGGRRSETLPSGFLRYERDLGTLPATWYLGLGHVQRMPDYWELFSPDRGPAGSANAFQGIRPEKTTQLDFGAQYRSGRLDAWFSGYAGVVDDFILFRYHGGGMMGGSSQVANIDARIFGGELGISYRVAPSWSVGATLAYSRASNRSDDRPLPQIPPLEARFSAGYDDGTWSAGMLWRVVAAQKRTSPGEGNVAGKDFGPSARFGVLSLNAAYAFDERISVSVGVDNLLDKTYSEHLNLAGNAGFGFPAGTAINEPGRTAWARVSIRY